MCDLVIFKHICKIHLTTINTFLVTDSMKLLLRKCSYNKNFFRRNIKPTGLQLTTSYPVDYRTRKHSYSTTGGLPCCSLNVMKTL